MDSELAAIEQYREDMHYDHHDTLDRQDDRRMMNEQQQQAIEERASMFARAVALSATAFETIKAAIPEAESAPPTAEHAERARALCDTLSSATFDLLMAALNSTTALSMIEASLHNLANDTNNSQEDA